MRILLIVFVYLTLTSCEQDINPIEVETSRNHDWDCPVNGQSYTEKLIGGQPCRVFYSDKVSGFSGWETAPDSIKTKAEIYLINQIGKSFFDSSFEFRSAEIIPEDARSQIRAECYIVSWFIRIKIADFSTWQIAACYLDSTGHVVREEGLGGLDSVEDSAEQFMVTDSLAIQTAQAYGLDAGISYWDVSFYYYYGDINSYVWNVTNFTDKYSGKGLIIASNKPEVLEEHQWMVVDAGGW